MFLALAQGWIDAALHLEQDIGLKSTDYRNLETQPVTREASPLNAFNQIPVGEMLWSTSRFRWWSFSPSSATPAAPLAWSRAMTRPIYFPAEAGC